MQHNNDIILKTIHNFLNFKPFSVYACILLSEFEENFYKKPYAAMEFKNNNYPKSDIYR